jgi:hypothetical protein
MVHSNVLDLSQVRPYADLSSLVSLAPEKLKGNYVTLNDNAKVHQLSDGHWHIVPSLTSPSLPRSAIIHDVVTDFAPSKSHDLTATDMLPNHYWRVPAGTATILAYLLHHVAHPKPSKSEEVRLAIELRALLMLRYINGGGPGYGRGHLGGPFNGGGNVGNKSERNLRKNTVSNSASLHTVSAVQGQILRGHTRPFGVHETFHTNAMGRAWSRPNRQRASITAVRHSLLSRLPQVPPIIPTMYRLQHRLKRFV